MADPSQMFLQMIIRPPRSEYEDPGTFEKSVKVGDKDVVFKGESFDCYNA